MDAIIAQASQQPELRSYVQAKYPGRLEAYERQQLQQQQQQTLRQSQQEQKRLVQQGRHHELEQQEHKIPAALRQSNPELAQLMQRDQLSFSEALVRVQRQRQEQAQQEQRSPASLTAQEQQARKQQQRAALSSSSSSSNTAAPFVLHPQANELTRQLQEKQQKQLARQIRSSEKRQERLNKIRDIQEAANNNVKLESEETRRRFHEETHVKPAFAEAQSSKRIRPLSLPPRALHRVDLYDERFDKTLQRSELQEFDASLDIHHLQSTSSAPKQDTSKTQIITVPNNTNAAPIPVFDPVLAVHAHPHEQPILDIQPIVETAPAPLHSMAIPTTTPRHRHQQPTILDVQTPTSLQPNIIQPPVVSTRVVVSNQHKQAPPTHVVDHQVRKVISLLPASLTKTPSMKRGPNPTVVIDNNIFTPVIQPHHYANTQKTANQPKPPPVVIDSFANTPATKPFVDHRSIRSLPVRHQVSSPDPITVKPPAQQSRPFEPPPLTVVHAAVDTEPVEVEFESFAGDYPKPTTNAVVPRATTAIEPTEIVYENSSLMLPPPQLLTLSSLLRPATAPPPAMVIEQPNVSSHPPQFDPSFSSTPAALRHPETQPFVLTEEQPDEHTTTSEDKQTAAARLFFARQKALQERYEQSNRQYRVFQSSAPPYVPQATLEIPSSYNAPQPLLSQMNDDGAANAAAMSVRQQEQARQELEALQKSRKENPWQQLAKGHSSSRSDDEYELPASSFVVVSGSEKPRIRNGKERFRQLMQQQQVPHNKSNQARLLAENYMSPPRARPGTVLVQDADGTVRMVPEK